MGQAMVSPNMLDKKSGGPSSSDSGESGCKVSSLGDRVYNYHHCVMTRRLREFSYEVNTNGVPRCIRERERVKLPDWIVSLSLGPEAQVAGRDIFPNGAVNQRPEDRFCFFLGEFITEHPWFQLRQVS